jgi:hypothetical protein
VALSRALCNTFLQFVPDSRRAVCSDKIGDKCLLCNWFDKLRKAGPLQEIFHLVVQLSTGCCGGTCCFVCLDRSYKATSIFTPYAFT